MERRELLRWLLTTAGLTCLDGLTADELAAFGTDVHRQLPREAQGATVLEPHARSTVALAAERIIPRTETPGATDANVVSFIDHMLANWHTVEERDRFLSGLTALDARARARCGKAFVDCGEADQVKILTAFDDEVTRLRRDAGGANPNDHWFAMLKYLTVFGYCTSEVAVRETLRGWPRPTRYDGCAPVAPAPRAGQG